MKAVWMFLAISLSGSLASAQGRSEVDRAKTLAKRANAYMHTLMNEDEAGGNRNGDLFGNYGYNKCDNDNAAVTIKGRQFSVLTICESYKITVTGNLGDGDDGISSAKIERNVR